MKEIQVFDGDGVDVEGEKREAQLRRAKERARKAKEKRKAERERQKVAEEMLKRAEKARQEAIERQRKQQEEDERIVLEDWARWVREPKAPGWKTRVKTALADVQRSLRKRGVQEDQRYHLTKERDRLRRMLEEHG